jgi:hypothetical protein
MHFKMTYVTRDFVHGGAQIEVFDPAKSIKVVLRQRKADDAERPSLEKNDGLIVATCERSLSDRLQAETLASGTLSLRKEAVKKVYDEMSDLIQRTLRLARWRTNSRGGPNPIRSAVPSYFVWSADGSNWKMVADSISARIRLVANSRIWSKDDAEFVQTEIVKGSSEPLGHELLREADVNRETNPRSSLILAVAAAEVGFKQFASTVLKDTAWLLELPSPPLTEMLARFPWATLKLRISGKVPVVPDVIIGELKKAVTLRNKIVHSGSAALDRDSIDGILDNVSDFLYFLDLVREGQPWPLTFIRPITVSHFKNE